MKKRLIIFLCLVCITVGATSLFTACGDGKSDGKKGDTHQHSLQTVEATESTCVAQGNIEYEKCIYCNALIKDGKQVQLADVTLPVDDNRHAHLTHYPEVPRKCDTDGVKEHDKCTDCNALLLNGVKVTQDDLVIPKLGTDHAWKDNGVECGSCDAYRLLYNGEYYTVDATNKYEITAAEQPLYSSSNDAKSQYIGEDGYYWSNRNSFATQSAKTSLDNNVVELVDGKYTITNTNSNGYNTFTRFAYGDGEDAYVGRFIMIYDYTVSADEGEALQRIGVKVTDDTATFINTDSQSKFIGRLSSEENNPTRSISKDAVYTFAYVVELTAENQLIQIVNGINDTCTATISNLHFINLEETATGVAGATLLYFGESSGKAIAKADCAHAYSQILSEKSPTCQQGGYVAHTHCLTCGKNFNADGDEIADAELYHDVIDHNYGELVEATDSTCTEKGHDAYYRCDMCKKYFDEQKTALQALPERDLAEHSWSEDYTYDSNKHWYECAVCHEHKDEDDHTPGAEATDTTPQTCTECGYVIAEATAHVHDMRYTEAHEATCTEDGNVEYWYCSGCNKYYSDADGDNILDKTAIDKNGHTMESPVEAKDPTCLEGGNLAYSHCTACDKYFDDADGTNDITDTYLRDKLPHETTHYEANNTATCYQRAHIEYYHCSTCNMLYTDVDGDAVKPSDVFSGDYAAHDYDAETGVCKNAGCQAKKVALPIDAPASGGSSDNGDNMKAATIANPGKWTVQYPTSGSAQFNDGTVQVTLSNHSKNTRNGFVRVIPADPNDPTKAYVGTYILSFDLTFTAIQKNSIKVGFGLQDAKTAVVNVSHEEDITIEQGKTIRFSVLVESTAADQYLQFIARNPASGNNKTFVISNATIEYLPNTSEGRWYEEGTATQMQTLNVLDLGTPVPDPEEEGQDLVVEAIADDKQYVTE